MLKWNATKPTEQRLVASFLAFFFACTDLEIRHEVGFEFPGQFYLPPA